jgi:hypothetical protein
MPFILPERRDGAVTGLYADPGDLCFKHYRAFMNMWNEEPRWRTIDKYAQRIWSDDEQRAGALALLVFMHKHGFKYEDDQCKKNGDIK